MIFRYVQNQQEHHQHKTFKEEYLGLLGEFKISYDTQYIFHDLKIGQTCTVPMALGLETML